jgi:hypothetical protein
MSCFITSVPQLALCDSPLTNLPPPPQLAIYEFHLSQLIGYLRVHSHSGKQIRHQ